MPAQKSRQPAGTIPVSCNATPDAYGLQVDEIGLGLHAAPSASVLVEPEMPTKAGLAVFYLKGGRGPAIFDLTRNFRPEFARPPSTISYSAPKPKPARSDFVASSPSSTITRCCWW